MMEEKLTEYLATHKPKGFRSVPHYFALGDYLTYYTRDERSYAERIDDCLTVYRSMETREIVGLRINGASRILEAITESFPARPEGASP